MSDLAMPDMDGYERMTLVRARGGYLVLVLTVAKRIIHENGPIARLTSRC